MRKLQDMRNVWRANAQDQRSAYVNSLGALPPLADPEKEFIARNLIATAQSELDRASASMSISARELAAERIARMNAEAFSSGLLAENEKLRRAQRARMPELRKRLYGRMWERMNAAHAGVVPNNLWLATSIALVLAGVVVMW